MSIEKYPSLNGLRAISIIIVLIHHLNDQIFKFPILNKIHSLIPLISDGQFGVNVFFIISGFLITSLLLKEKTKTGNISLKKFYIRRTLRIFPAYYFLLFIYLLLDILNIVSISFPSWITSITYTKYFNGNLDWITGHAWSLSIEEHFYLIWPLIFKYKDKFKNTFLLSILIICPIFRVLGLYHDIYWLNDLSIFQRLDYIALGCLLAQHFNKVILFLNRYKPILYLAIIWMFIFPFMIDISNTYHLHLALIIIPFCSSIGSITNLAISIILVYSITNRKGTWFSFLNSKIMSQIGILSYSIYLWQQLFTSNNFPLGKLIFPFNIILIIGVSLISFYVIEKPFLKLKTKFSVN